MNSEVFDRLVQTAYASLPAVFRDACGPLLVRSQSVASWETLRSMGIDDPYDLLGLYHGVSLPSKSLLDPSHGPDMVFLYRLPILAFASMEGLPVAQVVRHVLVHEVGHHFGFSDDDMEALEMEASEDD